MNGYLVDTNIPSELTRIHPQPKVETFLRQAGKEQVYLSVLSLGEIVKGIAALPPSQRRIALEDWLETEIRPWFGNRILPVSSAIAERWGLLAVEAKLGGIALSVVDGLLAATAFVHDLTLVTRNIKDFSGTGVKVINPWE